MLDKKLEMAKEVEEIVRECNLGIHQATAIVKEMYRVDEFDLRK